MIMSARWQPDWIERLPAVRGQLEFAAPLDGLTWFRTGGAADVLFRPADMEDLQTLIAALPDDVPVRAIGVGSNLLVRDGGLPGVVVRLPKRFAALQISEATVIDAGAGAMGITVATFARDHGLAGLEFLRGIPGTLGGAVRMNAGAYGRELVDILIDCDVLERDGSLRCWTLADMAYSYRHSALPDAAIVLSARLRGMPAERAMIDAEMQRIADAREASQPLRTRTGGSTFKNPEGQKAWQLIDAAGCRGLMIGGAQVSEKHCNFLINTGSATSADLEALGEEVRRRVKAHSGVDLVWEIDRIGRYGARLQVAGEAGDA